MTNNEFRVGSSFVIRASLLIRHSALGIRHSIASQD
jgi:hypothetical protein